MTGASQGIGAGLVKALQGRGYNVVANSRNITQSGAFEASDKLALVVHVHDVAYTGALGILLPYVFFLSHF